MRGIVPYATLLPSTGKNHRKSLKMLKSIALSTNKFLSHQLQSVKLLKVKNFYRSNNVRPLALGPSIKDVSPKREGGTKNAQKGDVH